MALIYNAQAFKDGKFIDKDYDTEAAARSLIEELGAGRVVTFLKATHAYDHDRSITMDCYEEGNWQPYDIHR